MNDMIWHEWHDLTCMTWFDMNDMIWHEWQDLTWMTWFDMNDMIWHVWLDLTWMTWFDMNDKIWHEWHDFTKLQDMTWITWFNMNGMIWDEWHDLTWMTWFDMNDIILMTSFPWICNESRTHSRAPTCFFYRDELVPKEVILKQNDFQLKKNVLSTCLVDLAWEKHAESERIGPDFF
jgi:hypothetical protein